MALIEKKIVLIENKMALIENKMALVKAKWHWWKQNGADWKQNGADWKQNGADWKQNGTGENNITLIENQFKRVEINGAGGIQFFLVIIRSKEFISKKKILQGNLVNMELIMQIKGLWNKKKGAIQIFI